MNASSPPAAARRRRHLAQGPNVRRPGVCAGLPLNPSRTLNAPPVPAGPSGAPPSVMWMAPMSVR